MNINYFKEFLEIIDDSVYSIFIVFIFWMLGKFLKRIIKKGGERSNVNHDVVNLIGSALKISMIVIGIVTAAGTLGVDIKAMIAGLGLTGFAVGFAVKDIISNFLAGVMTLIYEPFKHGDYLTITNPPGIEGEIISINFRYTVLQQHDGKKVLVPNSNLLTKEIIVKESESDIICPLI